MCFHYFERSPVFFEVQSPNMNGSNCMASRFQNSETVDQYLASRPNPMIMFQYIDKGPARVCNIFNLLLIISSEGYIAHQ